MNIPDFLAALLHGYSVVTSKLSGLNSHLSQLTANPLHQALHQVTITQQPPQLMTSKFNHLPTPSSSAPLTAQPSKEQTLEATTFPPMLSKDDLIRDCLQQCRSYIEEEMRMRLGDPRTPQHTGGGGVRFSFKGEQMRETGEFSGEAKIARKCTARPHDENIDPNRGS